MSSNQQPYDELITELKRISLLGSCASVLNWDRETYMPSGGAELRAEQVSLIAGLEHQWATSPQLGELLENLSQTDLGADDSVEAVNVREAKRSYERATKLPQRLVEELSRVSALSQHAWSEAKQANDFSAFEPWLKQMIALKREQAACLQQTDGPLYDALLDSYEPGMTTAQVQSTFSQLREQLVPLVAKIAEASNKPDRTIVCRSFPVDAQREFSKQMAAEIGFDFHRGRIDVSAHPFCSGFGPGDCRLTTRYDDHFFNMAFFGTLHEAGHGMYEQGLLPEHAGTPMGRAVSLGIHESQSRMWENLVGRSRSFWQHAYGNARKMFPESLGNVPLDAFYGAINYVEPSMIRVEADEVTYNLHIMLRFELEQKMIAGELEAEQIPEAWNETFREYFGIVPASDAEGCMQDVHWSAGYIGYFPTYALGNIYASQFFEAAQKQLGNLDELFARGEFQSLKEWLNKNIHQRGQQYPAAQLVEVVTGNSFSADALIKYLKLKFGSLYHLE